MGTRKSFPHTFSWKIPIRVQLWAVNEVTMYREMLLISQKAEDCRMNCVTTDSVLCGAPLHQSSYYSSLQVQSHMAQVQTRI